MRMRNHTDRGKILAMLSTKAWRHGPVVAVRGSHFGGSEKASQGNWICHSSSKGRVGGD